MSAAHLELIAELARLLRESRQPDDYSISGETARAWNAAVEAVLRRVDAL